MTSKHVLRLSLRVQVSDCCHSGSMLDHPEQQISGNKDPNAPPGAAAMDPMAMLGMFFKDIPVRTPLCLLIMPARFVVLLLNA